MLLQFDACTCTRRLIGSPYAARADGPMSTEQVTAFRMFQAEMKYDVAVQVSLQYMIIGEQERANLLAAIFLTLGAHAQRGLQYLVCPCVCLFVCRRLFWHYRLRGGL